MTKTAIKFPHISLIEENSIDIKTLPQITQKRITAFKMQLANYEKSPTENKENSMMAQSVKIADEIQDFIENGLPSDDGKEPVAAPVVPTAVEPTPTPSPVEPAKPIVNGLTNVPTDSDLKEAITKALDKEGRIYHVDLKRILKKRDLDDTIEIDGMKLTRSWGYYNVS